eukprot:TRINITY_DN3266_c0_g1_i2.p1 TRINITY_DN3266_c0_g1~~TRINITY_DN3266_c0_g1_i2.p1  ORF type:complete len:150 (-),score=45.19 TRINITY_DN3266_c0_g1_i2:87-536(-)
MLSLSFDAMEHNKEVKAFYDKINEIDERIKSLIKENSMDILGVEGKSATDKISKFKPTLRQNNEYPPIMNSGIAVNSEVPTVPIYLDENKKGTFDDVHRNSLIQAILSVNVVYVMGPNIGYSWAADQILVVEKGRGAGTPHDFAFRTRT